MEYFLIRRFDVENKVYMYAGQYTGDMLSLFAGAYPCRWFPGVWNAERYDFFRDFRRAFMKIRREYLGDLQFKIEGVKMTTYFSGGRYEEKYEVVLGRRDEKL